MEKLLKASAEAEKPDVMVAYEAALLAFNKADFATAVELLDKAIVQHAADKKRGPSWPSRCTSWPRGPCSASRGRARRRSIWRPCSKTNAPAAWRSSCSAPSPPAKAGSRTR